MVLIYSVIAAASARFDAAATKAMEVVAIIARRQETILVNF